MKRIMIFSAIILSILSLGGCGRLEQLKWEITPEEWLETHSYMEVTIGGKDMVLSEPSSSAIVFLLAFILVIAGVIVLRKRKDQMSGQFWGYGLLVWALSTIPAGISYQICSFMLKCKGREICLWTTWWEIWYLILFVISMNLIAVAVSYSSTEGRLRKIIHIYAGVNAVLYSGIALTGALLPNQIMVSFETMVLFVFPTFVILLVLNILRYRKKREIIDFRLAAAWILMFLVTVAYFISYLSPMADFLWERGIWFNANDVLHAGLIVWAVCFIQGVEKYIRDC